MDQRTKILGILAWVLIALGIVIVLVVLFRQQPQRRSQKQNVGRKRYHRRSSRTGKSAFWMISIIAENMEDTADRVKIPDSLSWGFFNAGLKAIKPCRS